MNILDRCRSRVVHVRNGNLQKNPFVQRGRRIVNHGLDAYPVVFFHAIAEAGNLRPICELAARAKDVFFLVGAEEIRTIFIPESDVVKNHVVNGIARSVH
jgi:hypothetical protein